MAKITTFRHRLTCDLCHAIGYDEEVEEGISPQHTPEGWRWIGRLKIVCPDCIAKMTLPEYLAILDHAKELSRQAQERWEAHKTAKAV